MNNFFSTINVNMDVVNKDYTFDEVIQTVSMKMKGELTADNLMERFGAFVRLKQNIILRFIPLFIKDILLKNIGKMISDRGSTTSFSNLGIVSLKDEIKVFVNKFDMIAYTDDSLSIKLGLCSFGDVLSISFSSIINSTELERTFFTTLVKQGLKVNISSSIGDVFK